MPLLDAGAPRTTVRGAAMAIDHALADPVGFTCYAATTPEAQAVCAAVTESGYEMPGLAWLMAEQGNFDAPDVVWHIVSDDGRNGSVGESCGVAAGFLAGDTGGVYYVATPPQHRNRGSGAAATAYAVNDLFARGARIVTLQASPLGRPVYERLGFRTYDNYARFTFHPANADQIRTPGS